MNQFRMILQYHEIFGQFFVPNLNTYVQHEKGFYNMATNSLGMRSSREYNPQKAPGNARILVFGDSFTAGEGVSNSERFTDLLENSHKTLEVLNFGLPGSGTDQQLLVYEHFSRVFEADIIMVCVLVENINRIANKYRPAIGGNTRDEILVPKPYFTFEDGCLKPHNIPVPRQRILMSEASGEVLDNTDLSGKFPILRRFINRYFFFLKESFMKFSAFNPYSQYSSSDNPDWQLMKALLEKFIIESGGKKVVIVPLPTYHYIEGLCKPIYLNRFQELAKANPGTHLIDVLPYFGELSHRDKRRCRFIRDIHYTPFAHNVVAKALGAELKKRDLI